MKLMRPVVMQLHSNEDEFIDEHKLSHWAPTAQYLSTLKSLIEGREYWANVNDSIRYWWYPFIGACSVIQFCSIAGPSYFNLPQFTFWGQFLYALVAFCEIGLLVFCHYVDRAIAKFESLMTQLSEQESELFLESLLRGCTFETCH